MVVFPDFFDEHIAPRIGYLPGQMLFKLGAKMEADAGIVVVNQGTIVPDGRTHKDGRVLTGDSPDAADALGRLAATEMLKALA